MRVVQLYGLADLLQHKLAVAFQFGRGQAFGPSGYADWIGTVHSDTFNQFLEHYFKTVVVTPHHGRIALISLTRRSKMEDFMNGTPLNLYYIRPPVFVVCSPERTFCQAKNSSSRVETSCGASIGSQCP
jgi:hypothetical protein